LQVVFLRTALVVPGVLEGEFKGVVAVELRERVRDEPLQEVGNSVAQITGESRSLERMPSTAVSNCPRSPSEGRHGCDGSFLAYSWARPENTAAPRLPPETELVTNTCWAKLRHRSCIRPSSLAV
jgi:hypothetical protein